MDLLTMFMLTSMATLIVFGAYVVVSIFDYFFQDPIDEMTQHQRFVDAMRHLHEGRIESN